MEQPIYVIGHKNPDTDSICEGPVLRNCRIPGGLLS